MTGVYQQLLPAKPVSIQRQCVNTSHAQPDCWPSWVNNQWTACRDSVYHVTLSILTNRG